MITRWRLEADADNREDVEEDIEGATQAVLLYLKKVQPDDEWECTDEVYVPIEIGGDPIMYGRRVFRRDRG